MRLGSRSKTPFCACLPTSDDFQPAPRRARMAEVEENQPGSVWLLSGRGGHALSHNLRTWHERDACQRCRMHVGMRGSRLGTCGATYPCQSVVEHANCHPVCSDRTHHQTCSVVGGCERSRYCSNLHGRVLIVVVVVAWHKERTCRVKKSNQRENRCATSSLRSSAPAQQHAALLLGVL